MNNIETFLKVSETGIFIQSECAEKNKELEVLPTTLSNQGFKVLYVQGSLSINICKRDQYDLAIVTHDIYEKLKHEFTMFFIVDELTHPKIRHLEKNENVIRAYQTGKIFVPGFDDIYDSIIKYGQFKKNVMGKVRNLF